MHSRPHAFLTHPLAASSLASWQAIIPNQLCIDRDFSVFSRHACNDSHLRSTECGNFIHVGRACCLESLPAEIRTATSRTAFLCQLKTHFYNKHCNCIP